MRLPLSARIVLLVLVSSNVPAAAPYAGEQGRDIKALSPQDVDAYLNGQGMGLAKAAELNGYAGPKHVLELGSELALSAEQRKRTESLQESLRRIGSLQAQVRVTHLAAHLEQARILTPKQAVRYAQLRGYGQMPAHHAH